MKVVVVDDSLILSAQGQLVGVNFDRAFEAT